MKTVSLLDSIAEFGRGLAFGVIPDRIVAAATWQYLDTLGCAIAARSHCAAGSRILALAEGRGPATALGVRHGVPPSAAARINGTLSHMLDYDTTHPAARCHVSSVVFPAASAVGERVGASGSELLAAATAGCEVAIALGIAARGSFAKHGYHATPICGIFGAVTAVARLLDFGHEMTCHALGIAAGMAAGLGEPYRVLPAHDTKSLQVGWAAGSAVDACAIAAAGITAPRGAIDGRFGLFPSHLGRDAPGPQALRALADGLGRAWELDHVSLKFYPACHGVHSSLECFRDVARDTGISAGDIVTMTAYLPEYVTRIVARPKLSKLNASTGYDGKFSLYLSLASMAVDGSVGIGTYADSSISRQAVRQMARRIRVRSRKFATESAAYPAALDIESHAGAFHREIPYEPGHVNNPLPPTRIREKFDANCRVGLQAKEAAELASACLRLRHVADIRTYMSILASAGVPGEEPNAGNGGGSYGPQSAAGQSAAG